MLKKGTPSVSFIRQDAPVDEYGRALYAICRSVLRAVLDSLSKEDLTDLNTPLEDVTLRQLAKVVRLDRDKGMRGDGFEWAVHEAIIGKEPLVLEPIHHALKRCSTSVKDQEPSSIMFGEERAKYLGFVDAVVDQAGEQSFLLPEGSGRPFYFGPWVTKAALGHRAEAELPERIKKVWKTDIFLSTEADIRYFPATIKSNYEQLEGGKGLRVGIVPESTHIGNRAGVRYSQKHKLWTVTLADPNGFMGLFNDGYMAVGRVMCALGRQVAPPYYTKPSAKAQQIQEQMEKYGSAKVVDVEAALNEAAQQDLVSTQKKLLGVNAPQWLHMKTMAPRVIAPKPSFKKLD
jgi:hypothetical protein